ncbi:unnamed protein product [Trichogramma brassicae]|uniref:BTB domain-containing protein n=1 Tax=Trichogramma brassicae TaxID=86971 RepID=A0A6H5IH56_9HYME|nr:unnamed protein product [Trichogramma brassicae]
MSTRGDDSSSIGTNDDLPNSEDEPERRKTREAMERRIAREEAAKIGQASTSTAASNNNDDHRPKAKKVAQPVVELLPRIAEPPGHRRTEEEAKKEGGGEEVQYFTFNWNIRLEPEHIKQGTIVNSSIFKTNYFDVGMSVRTVYEPCQNCQNGQKQEAWHLHLHCGANCGTAAEINLSDKFEFGMATQSGNTFSFCQLHDQTATFQSTIGLSQEPNLTSGTQYFKIQCRLPDSCFSDRIAGVPRTRSMGVGVHQDIHEHYFDLLRSGEFSDVTIQLDDCEIKAHQHILSAASLELRKLFDEAPKEQPLQSIVVNGFSVRDFQIFLKCIYTGRVEGLREHFETYMMMANRFRVPSLLRILDNFAKIVRGNNGIDQGEPLEWRPDPIGFVYFYDHEYEQLCLEAELARGTEVEDKIIYLHQLDKRFWQVALNKENESDADANGNAGGNSTDSDQQRDAQASAREQTNPVEKRKQKKYKKGQKKPPQLSAIDEARASVEREAARQADEDAKKQQRVEIDRVPPAPEPEQARMTPAADPSAFIPVPSRRTTKLSKRQAKKKK